MVTPLAFVAAVLSVVSFTEAIPTRRDDAFCVQLLTSCVNAGSNAISDPWSIPACIYGATCFGGSHPIDGFLAAVAASQNATAKASLNVPRVTVAVFNHISTDEKVVTQQNFIDGVYGTLSATNGPYPDVSLVISSFQRVAIWTAFCNGAGVPFKNFADYFQFAATVNSNGCPTTTSSGLPISLPISTTIAPILSTSSVTATFLTSTVSTATGPTATPPPFPNISSEPSCQWQFETCVQSVNSDASNAWSQISCLLAASCFGGQRPVDGLLSVVFTTKTGKSSSLAPTSLAEARLSNATLNKISTNGSTVTVQNWIDAYYGQIAATGGPFPTSSAVVISDFQRIQQWTVFCGAAGIPFMNVADYFEFSSSVSSPTSC
ncbi:hypothetical protein HYPSUDRAFT_57929 [Hypholoma sublateritium FD-334 SS-4]|uniref:Uncharacterized protein n=1 Tax=Hypholoma sublateritium (strain FD-334 SS-4) TaxID=945553 RepID=A0A0D2M136_HYPSF|nr:hypothetical protein HYPSUDRAFT_57929 [Hypholoma sublateritium FD-334 SS-4]